MRPDAESTLLVSWNRCTFPLDEYLFYENNAQIIYFVQETDPQIFYSKLLMHTGGSWNLTLGYKIYFPDVQILIFDSVKLMNKYLVPYMKWKNI